MKHARIVTLIAAAIMVAGCGTAEQAGRHPTGANPVAAPAGNLAGYVKGNDQRTPIVTAPEAAHRTMPPSMLNPSPFPGCPLIVANPVGCPLPAPRPVMPPLTGHARIALCLPWPGGPPVRTGPLLVCGAGFRPAESVVVVVVGRLGALSVPTHAAADGTIRLTLPPSACRIAPTSIAAHGNLGSVSNTIALPPLICRTY